MEKHEESFGFYLGGFSIDSVSHIKNVTSAQKFSICYGSNLFNEMFCETLNIMLNLSSISLSSNKNTWVTVAL